MNGVPGLSESVLALLNSKSQLYHDRIALSIQTKDGWRDLSYEQLSNISNAISEYLIEQKFARGGRIAILGESSPEWVIAFFAAIRCGGSVVPLDVKLTPHELHAICREAMPSLIFASASQRKITEEIADGGTPVIHFESFDRLKPSRSLEGIDRYPEETALLVYTSGTTGSPKGVMISFGSLIFEATTLTELMEINSSDVFISILPLNHLLELTGGLLSVLCVGGQVCYSHSLYPQEVLQIMHEKEASYMVTVPLFLRLLKAAIAKGGTIGKRMKGFICGGAPLDQQTAEFFSGINLPVYQGYGLTETSPVVAVNTPQANKIGTVGKPVPRVEVRFADNGEILTRGPNLMQGYYHRKDLTREVIDSDGWFHTGDVGFMDEDGFLCITGRIRNLIVLGGGKKVQPEEVETVFSKAPAVKEVCALGCIAQSGYAKGTEQVYVVVVPTDSIREQFKNEPQRLKDEIERQIEEVSKDLASYKRPSRILIREAEFPKTSTRKIKRDALKEWVDSYYE